MKRKIMLGLVLSVGLLPMMQAHAADTKIGYVNVKVAIQNTDAYQQGQKELKVWQTKKQQEIAKYAKRIQELDTEIKTQGMAMSAESKDQKIRQLKSLDKIAKRKLQDAREEGSSKEERLWLDSSKNFKRKVTIFGKKSGYDLILSSTVVLYGKPMNDLTSDITKVLNKK